MKRKSSNCTVMQCLFSDLLIMVCVCVRVPDHQAVPGDPELLGCGGPTQHAARGLYLGCGSGETVQTHTWTHAALICQTVPAGRGCQILILITVM